VNQEVMEDRRYSYRKEKFTAQVSVKVEHLPTRRSQTAVWHSWSESPWNVPGCMQEGMPYWAVEYPVEPQAYVKKKKNIHTRQGCSGRQLATLGKSRTTGRHYGRAKEPRFPRAQPGYGIRTHDPRKHNRTGLSARPARLWDGSAD